MRETSHSPEHDAARMAAPRHAPTGDFGSGFLGALGETARNNPMAAALLGTGVLWLLMGGQSTSLGQMVDSGRTAYQPVGRRRPHSMGQSVVHAARKAGSSVSEAAGTAYEAVAARASQMGGMLSGSDSESHADYRDTDQPGFGAEGETQTEWQSRIGQQQERASASVLRNSREALSEVFENQPLMIGLAGMALGAGIAAVLPATRTERRTMGQASDYVHGKAAEAASEAKEVMSAAADEAKRQGLGQTS